MTKVLVFTTQFYQLGGAERLSVDLARALNARGIDAGILSMYAPTLPGVPEATALLRDQGVPAVHFLGLPFGASPLAVLSAVRRLRRLLHQNHYDVVETSLRSPTLIASLAVRGTGTQLVAGVHQVYRPEHAHSLQDRIWRHLVARERRTSYYAISESVAAHWARFSGTPSERIAVVHNAVRDEFFAAVPDPANVRDDLKIPRNGRIALYVGRLAAYKGIDTVVEGIGPIADRDDLYLVFIGVADPHVPGTTEMLARIDAQLRAAPWGNRVRFAGFRHDVPRVMASADVLVHPTHTEGFGLVLAEAMAAGLPIVASDVEGIPEVVRGSGTVLIEARNAEALRRGVEGVLRRSAAERAAVAERGRACAERFREDRRVDALIALLGHRHAKRGAPPRAAPARPGTRVS